MVKIDVDISNITGWEACFDFTGTFPSLRWQMLYALNCVIMRQNDSRLKILSHIIAAKGHFFTSDARRMVHSMKCCWDA